jgi:hypothetical protein
MNDERCTKDSRSGDDIVISRARGYVFCERTPVEVDLPGKRFLELMKRLGDIRHQFQLGLAAIDESRVSTKH